MTNWNEVVRLALSHKTPHRAAIVAMIVGSTLNLINQGDVLWWWGDVNWSKAVLTYVVPFIVSMHGSISTQMKMTKNSFERKI